MAAKVWRLSPSAIPVSVSSASTSNIIVDWLEAWEEQSWVGRKIRIG
jgi:uncharacterized protein YcbX